MFSWIIGIPLITLFATIGLAIAVIPWTRHESSRPTLDVLIVLIALWAFGSVMLHTVPLPSTEFWLAFIVICSTGTGAFGVHFSAQFTQQRTRIAKLAVTTIYALSILLVVLILSGQIVDKATLLSDGTVSVSFIEPAASFMWGVIGTGTLVALFFLISTVIKSPKPEKKRFLFPLIGYLVMCFGSLSNLFYSAYPVDIAANFIFVSLLTYGVIGTHLLKPAIRRQWQLSLITLFPLLALCYIAMLLFCFEWLKISANTSHLIASLTVIAFGTGTFRPARELLLNRISKRLFPNIYDYKHALIEIANLDNSIENWEHSTVSALNIITKTVQAKRAALLFRNDKTQSFEVKLRNELNSSDFAHGGLPVDSQLVKELRISGNIIIEDVMEPISKRKDRPPAGDSGAKELDCIAYCGIQGYHELLAVVAVALKSHQKYFGAEEKDFLVLACHQIAPIIGNAFLYQASQREIAERKQAEERVTRAAAEWRVTFDAISDMVLLVNKDYKIIRANNMFYQVINSGPHETLGKHCYDVLCRNDEPGQDCIVRKTIKTGKLQMAELLYPELEIYVEASTSPIFNQEGEIEAIVYVARDITERKRLQEQLIVTDRLASIGELAAGVAHELNNPLTSVIGYSELLLSQDIRADIKEDVEVINREAKRTSQIVKNLLSFARKQSIERAPLNINDTIEEILQLRAYEQKTQNIEINKHFAPDLPQMIASSFQLKQVFINIVINAEYFMSEAHGRGTLTITTERIGDLIRISFADDGPGVKPEILGHLFDPFFTTKEVGKGTGLGLSICYGLVNEHAGRIYAESEPGQGTTFIVELPVGQLKDGTMYHGK